MTVTMESLFQLTRSMRNEPEDDVPPRNTDRQLVDFLNDQENSLELSDDAVSRLLLLNKRRKSHEGKNALVFSEGESPLTHLDDCFEIVKLVSPEIKTSAIIHDIGKTGPKNADIKTREIIMALFAEIHNLDIREGRILDLLIKIYDEPKILQDAVSRLKKIGISPDMTLNDFYPMHVDWGAEVLKDELNITDREKYVALNHHQMWRDKAVEIDGFRPDEDTVTRTQELELADFYQATRTRSKKSPSQAQSLLRTIFVNQIPLKKLNAMIDKIVKRDQTL